MTTCNKAQTNTS
ncbi:hypothetical protein LINPERPRIM_LOCUS24992 [Linum perenne]